MNRSSLRPLSACGLFSLICPACDGKGADPCAFDDPTLSTLAYAEPAPDGVSAEDMFAWAIGTFEADLYWDDGTSTRVSLMTAPEDATLTTYGPLGECAGPSLALDVAVSVATADERLALAFETSWFAEETNDVGHLGSVPASQILSSSTMGIAPMSADSAVTLHMSIDDDDGIGMSMEERWSLAEHTERVCTRAALTASLLGCHDETEDTGNCCE